MQCPILCIVDVGVGRAGEILQFCLTPVFKLIVFCRNSVLTGRRCEFAGCTKWPLYAFEGEKAKYCSQHKVSRGVSHCFQEIRQAFVEVILSPPPW